MTRIPSGVHVAYDGESGDPQYWVVADDVAELVADLSSSGPVDDAAAYWRTRVQWVASDNALRRHLRGFGAWDDLATADTETLRIRTLFVTNFDDLTPISE